MDSEAPGLDFAVIGHQDSWQNISTFINGLRANQQELSFQKIKDIFSYIPPAGLFRVNVRSTTGAEINGMYIDTFIDPDKLDTQFTRANAARVMNAVAHAKKNKAGIVALGGFTSIVLEGNFDLFSQGHTSFTTGNTLTAAYIVKGIETATVLHKIDLQKATVLIVGATGDIGMACVHYLKHKAGKLLLCARNYRRLEALARSLAGEYIAVSYSVSLNDLLAGADIIICVANSTGIRLNGCKKHVLICDAGYPKNLESNLEDDQGRLLFHGGMGQVSRGFRFDPDYSATMYKYPAPFVIHGCILEAMILAFEKRFENYSSGKGNIKVERMEEIYNLGIKHGITPAPFYNSKGLWKE